MIDHHKVTNSEASSTPVQTGRSPNLEISASLSLNGQNHAATGHSPGVHSHRDSLLYSHFTLHTPVDKSQILSTSPGIYYPKTTPFFMKAIKATGTVALLICLFFFSSFSFNIETHITVIKTKGPPKFNSPNHTDLRSEQFISKFAVIVKDSRY